MAEALRTGTHVTFGPFTFDLESLELFRNATKVALPPKPAHALALLVERAGRVVRREDLVRALWVEAHVNFDKSLNFTMLQLRRALEDDVRRPRYVETLPRLGYRFIATVGHPARPARSPQRWRSVALGGATLAAVFGLLFAARGRPAPNLTARAHAVYARDLLRVADETPRLREAQVREAIARLEQAVALDADHGGYWLELANAHFRPALDPERLRRVRPLVERAMKLDSTAPLAHLRLGDLRCLLDWDWGGARDSYETALKLDPTFAEAYRHLATLELIQGRADQAVAHIERALALEPLSSVLRGEVGWTHLYAGDFQAALRHCDQALAIDPTAWHARQCAMYASAWLGDDERTQREAARLLGARNGAPDAPPGEPMTLPVFHRRYLSGLGNTGWDRMERVLTLASLGETEAAVNALDAAVADRLPQALFRLRDPRLRQVRDTQRFGEIVARLRLELTPRRHTKV